MSWDTWPRDQRLGAGGVALIWFSSVEVAVMTCTGTRGFCTITLLGTPPCLSVGPGLGTRPTKDPWSRQIGPFLAHWLQGPQRIARSGVLSPSEAVA